VNKLELAHLYLVEHGLLSENSAGVDSCEASGCVIDIAERITDVDEILHRYHKIDLLEFIAFAANQ